MAPIRSASARPARACRATPQTAACASEAPRAARPTMMPARTSPDPDVPRPASLLTPHAGEMAHLTGATKEAVSADPERHAREAALRWNAVVALKGATTYIATPDGDCWRHVGSQPGLGTSGSGDVLAGIIVGLMARGVPLAQAAVWGIALHAHAGRALAERLGPIGYLARELPAEIPILLDKLAR